MTFDKKIFTALLLDLVLGDPGWLPHPVKLIGSSALFFENFSRRIIKDEQVAGIFAAGSVTLSTAGSFYLLQQIAKKINPFLEDTVDIFILYTSIAIRDLISHSVRVYNALAKDKLNEARKNVSFMVGRDTALLDEQGVIRACIESVAENVVDGITAPLFFAFVFGVHGAVIYKIINTLDSTFGYKNERYIKFGTASAKMDDLFNFIPARTTAPLVPLSALILSLNIFNSMKIFIRDGRKHPSPNAGLTEAAFAGALDVQLGGESSYNGRVVKKPLLGDPKRELKKEDILKANALAATTTVIAVVLYSGIRKIATTFFKKRSYIK